MSKQPILKSILCFLILSLGSYANASIIRAINDSETEWMEFSETMGLSRVEVETLLVDSSSSLYGYRYASREETELLFRSYVELPDYLNVFYSDMAPAGQEILNDFGTTFIENFGGTSQMTTEDNVVIDYNMAINSYFMHGSTDECGMDFSCIGRIFTYALDDVVKAWDPVGRRGADQFDTNPDLYSNSNYNPILASLLINDNYITAVPLPAAVWLFGSGLIGLISIARRKEA